MPQRHDVQAIDAVFTVEGNTLVAQDLMSDGSISCIKARCGDYQSPEHAELVGYILTDPRLMIASCLGQITQEVLDKAAAELRRRRA